MADLRIFPEMATDTSLRAQSWRPVRPGDVVLSAFDHPARAAQGYGETYLAVGGPADEYGDAPIMMVSQDAPGVDAEELTREFHDLWFDVGSTEITVIRGGRVIYGQPLTQPPTIDREANRG